MAGGASVKTAQELARHSTPVLTIGRYSHARLHDMQGALDAMPDLATPPEVTATPQAMAATGTCNSLPVGTDSILPAKRQQYSSKTTQETAGSCESPPSGNDNADCPNVLPITGLSDNRRESAEWSGAGSNCRHTDFQSVALPTELPDRIGEKHGNSPCFSHLITSNARTVPGR